MSETLTSALRGLLNDAESDREHWKARALAAEKEGWEVKPGSAKDRMAPSTDCLIGRLPAGTQVTIDVGRSPPFGLGRNAIVSMGTPDGFGGWRQGLVGSAWTVFSPETAYGDHVFENALHDALENLQAKCAAHSIASSISAKSRDRKRRLRQLREPVLLEEQEA